MIGIGKDKMGVQDEDAFEPMDGRPVSGHAKNYHGRVYARSRTQVGVVGDMGSRWLRVALSCLIEPDIGDTVLVSIGPRTGFITAVLERHGRAVPTLRLPASTVVACEGTLTLKAGQGMHLHAGKAMLMNAPAAGLTFGECALHAGRLHTSGKSWHGSWQERHDCAGLRVQTDGQVEHAVGERVTRVSGHDELSARSQRIVIERDWRVRARTVDVRGQRRVSIDGEQVQLG